jgi:two-component system response regulator FixJ
MSSAAAAVRAICCVYIVDDDEAFRRSLELLLASDDWRVESFASAAEFANRAPELEPGILLLDLHLDGTSGLDLLEEDGAGLDRFAVVMVTGAGAIQTAVRSIKAGAIDFIEKPFAGGELLDRLEAVAGDFAASMEARSAIFEAREKVEALTPRERDVLEGLLTGASNKMIARNLEISPRTVEMHRARMVQKLGADTTAEALEIGRTAGLKPA